MTVKRYLVTRDVAYEHPNNWSGRDVEAGEIFDEFTGVTYGSCNERDGIVLENPLYNSFFEFPRDAVEALPEPVCGGTQVEGYDNGVTGPEPWPDVTIGPGGIDIDAQAHDSANYYRMESD